MEKPPKTGGFFYGFSYLCSMEKLKFSFIVPVFNRPQEIEELLQSMCKLEGDLSFEVVVVEDGSDLDCKKVVSQVEKQLNITYLYKQNSGPGDSRNYGMKHAKGNYFIILDSDCLLPNHYLKVVKQCLEQKFVHCFGGPDAAHHSFTPLQKAINFSMTSVLTTGGIRGGRKSKKFQPRSFNMGLSKEAFEASKGFGIIHPGEDPDLSIRLWELGFETALFQEAYVFHKRRISWSKFYQQVHKFGLVRPILNSWHPKTASLVYWFPLAFTVGFFLAIFLALLGFKYLLMLFLIYFSLCFIVALFSSKNLYVALLSGLAIFIQFLGYGFGFLKSTFHINLLQQDPKKAFPKLFFTK